MTAKLPFPPLRPSSTTDAVVIRANDWAAFRQLEHLADHWTAKAWPPGRTGYYWYLTCRDPAVVELAQLCRRNLGHDGIDPVPDDGLHMTLLGIGNTHKVSDAQLEQIRAAAAAKLAGFPSFDVEVGPLTGSRSALRFSVAPWNELLRLHRVLRDATAEYHDANRLAETDEFRPHLGIGYLNRADSAAPLIEEISNLRDLPPATIHVDSVHLVELRREGRAYRWTDRHVLSLDGELPSGPENRRAVDDHTDRAVRTASLDHLEEDISATAG